MSNKPVTIPGNVPGAYMTILGPAPTEAQQNTPEQNKAMLEEPEWRRAFYFGVCSGCMLSLPFCVCDDGF
jgi:hypothetical protein